MHDDKYVFATDIFSLKEPLSFPEATETVTITVDREVELWRYSKGARGKTELVGDINIGDMVYTRVE